MALGATASAGSAGPELAAESGLSPRPLPHAAGESGGGRLGGEFSLELAGQSLRESRHIVGVFGSYGVAHTINSSSDINVTTFGARWSRPGHEIGTGWRRGHPTFAVELMPAIVFAQQPRPFGAGFNLLYEHRFTADGKHLPVLRLGAGALLSTERVPLGETHGNFSLLGGIGYDVMIDHRRFLSVEYRFHHISNAEIGPQNPGINAHSFVAGLSYYLP